MVRSSFLTALLALAPSAPAGLAFAPVQENDQDLSEWIERGRQAIEAGDLELARQLLEQAAALDTEGNQGRIWLLRLEIAEGKTDTVLSAVSKMKREGGGMDVTYLLGLAMAAKARAEVANGGSASLQYFLEDARNSLSEATGDDPDRYRDAHGELAWAAHQLGDYEVSEAAARAGLERKAGQPELHMLLGRIHLSRLSDAYGLQPADLDRLRENADPAEEHFGKVLELLPEDTTDPAELTLAAQAHDQIGTVRAFLGDLDGAAAAYTEALARDPNAIQIGNVLSVVENKRFCQVLSDASARFVERFGDEDNRDATLQWWLGWALYDSNDPSRFGDAETALEVALAKFPGYTSSHYYLGLVRLASQDYDGALERFRTHAQVAETELYGMVANDRDRLDSLIGLLDHFYQANRLADAAFVGEMLANGYPTHAPYWNNVGLFLRDHGATLAGIANEEGDESEETWSEINALWERSYTAYLKSLELEPENPAYLNDTAVILHYYLQRDYETAIEMYERAAALAKQAIDSGELSGTELEIIQTALRDARNNRALLERNMSETEEADELEKTETGNSSAR